MSSMDNSHDNAQNGSEQSQHLNSQHLNSEHLNSKDSHSGQTDSSKATQHTDATYTQQTDSQQTGSQQIEAHPNTEQSQSAKRKKNTKQGQNTGRNQQRLTHIEKDFSSIAALNQKLNQPFAEPATAKGLRQALPLNDEQQAIQKAVQHAKLKIKKQQMEERLARLYSERQLKGTSIRHPNFNTSKPALDPARSLADIPDPTPRYQGALQHLLSGNERVGASNKAKVQSSVAAQQGYNLRHDDTSMWGLIASPELASHLELLQLGGLINLPAQFFEPVPAHTKVHTKKTHTAAPKTANTESAGLADLTNTTDSVAKRDNEWSLLKPLSEMTLLDLADIQQACQAYPNLTRYGFAHTESDSCSAGITSNGSQLYKQKPHKASATASASKLATTMPEMINDIFAPNWELILYPERFDNGIDSLATDILDCSVAVHILKQCQSRQTINRRFTAQQICQHMRSYVLSQCNRQPQFEKQYRQIRLFVGHVVVAAHYLGLDVLYAHHHATNSVTNCQGKTSNNLGQPIYLNVSSRSALFHRYPNISSYYINGWS